jgi:hypothetical protein
VTDFKDRQGGGYTSAATQFLVNTATVMVAVPSASNRISARVANVGAAPLYLGYGATAIATSTQAGVVVNASAAHTEPDYLGAIYVSAASGGTSLVAVNEVRF